MINYDPRLKIQEKRHSNTAYCLEYVIICFCQYNPKQASVMVKYRFMTLGIACEHWVLFIGTARWVGFSPSSGSFVWRCLKLFIVYGNGSKLWYQWPTVQWSCLVGKPSSYWGLIILSHSHMRHDAQSELEKPSTFPTFIRFSHGKMTSKSSDCHVSAPSLFTVVYTLRCHQTWRAGSHGPLKSVM